MDMMQSGLRGHQRAPGFLSPAASFRSADESQRYLEDRGGSPVSDNYPAGLSSIRESEALRSSGSEARTDARRGEAAGGVPDRSRSRSDSASTVVPDDEMEQLVQRTRRDVSLDVRLAVHEREAIRERAHALGVKPSAWGRAVMLDALDTRRDEVAKIISAAAPPQPELARAVEQLRRVGVNLNQTKRDGSVVDNDLLVRVLSAVNEVRALLGDRTAT